MKSIAIFAGGNGSNAENIIQYFMPSQVAKVKMIFCNNAGAAVIARAHKHDIPCIVFSKKNFMETFFVEDLLQQNNIDLIVLAGFMWLLPFKFIEAFSNRIVNIHPALLPKYGGKGMYGHHVHDAVIHAQDKETGITIHYVNDKYDEGKIILQHKISISGNDNANTIQQRVKELEYQFYPKTIEQIIENI